MGKEEIYIVMFKWVYTLILYSFFKRCSGWQIELGEV